MQVIEQEGLKIHVDDDGFLVNLEDWTEQVARVLAAREGIADLPEDRLDILKFMRSITGSITSSPSFALYVQKCSPAQELCNGTVY
jgi:TusE/DsrC/DsvC family sulfur relay protein